MARAKRAGFFANLLRKLPSGWIPLESVMVVECLDDEGKINLFIYKTPTCPVWKAYGMAGYVYSEFAPETTSESAEGE